MLSGSDSEDGTFSLAVYTPSAREQLSRRGLEQGGPRQPCVANDSDLGFADCFKPVAIHGSSTNSASRSPATPASAATQATTKVPLKAAYRLELVSAVARIHERQGSAWAFLPEELARELLSRTLGEADATLAAYIVDSMPSLPTPPPAGQPRTAALLFTALALYASAAGRGAAYFLAELLALVRRTARQLGAAPASQGGPAVATAASPIEHWRDLLREAVVLFRHGECGDEVQPVLDAVEQALQLEERDRLRQQQQEAVWGPGGLLLTPEQISAACLSFRDPLTNGPITNMLQAWAGSAKTTQLRTITQQRRDVYFHVLSYNISTDVSNAASMDVDLRADHNAGKCPDVRNFQTLTTHGFARAIRRPETKAEKLNVGDLRTFLAQLWGAAEKKLIAAGATRVVNDVLERYMTSADDQLDSKHLPQDPRSLQSMDEQMSRVMWRLQGVPARDIAKSGRHPDYSRRMVVEAAQALWQEVSSRRTPSGGSTSLPLPHNCHLKRCALQRLRLPAPPPPPWGRWADVVILVDEAQDLNAVTMQLIFDQMACRWFWPATASSSCTPSTTPAGPWRGAFPSRSGWCTGRCRRRSGSGPRSRAWSTAS